MSLRDKARAFPRPLCQRPQKNAIRKGQIPDLKWVKQRSDTHRSVLKDRVLVFELFDGFDHIVGIEAMSVVDVHSGSTSFKT